MRECKVFLAMLLALFLGSTQGRSEDTELSFAIVYNNVPHDPGLTTAWGMSCLIKGMEKTILFDTGGDGPILVSNMRKMGIDTKSVDIVFLSHIHGDHVGGLGRFLEINNDVGVYLPESFPKELQSKVREQGAEVFSIHDFVEICENVYSTGEMSGSRGGIEEQSLIIDTPKGLIVVTGCAHPGVVKIVRRSHELLKHRVYLVLGGFHLMAYSESEVEEIIKELKELGVEKVGPSHCTGGRPIELFREAWGEDFFDLGCGATIDVDMEESDDRRDLDVEQ